MFRSILSVGLLLFPGTASTGAQDRDQDETAAIIALEREALDCSDRGDVSRFLELSDPDVVYIDPSLEKPIYGLAALTEYYSSFPAEDPNARGEMLNVKVQLLGNTAVLTFNYKSEIGPSQGWNVTEVYCRREQGWRIVHTNWSYVQPQMP